jgi:hypothetical protein
MFFLLFVEIIWEGAGVKSNYSAWQMRVIEILFIKDMIRNKIKTLKGSVQDVAFGSLKPTVLGCYNKHSSADNNIKRNSTHLKM